MLDLILTNKKELLGNVRLKGILGFGDHEVVGFAVLRAMSRAQSKLISLQFRITDFGLFRDLLSTEPWD